VLATTGLSPRLFAQGNLPSAPPVPIVTDDGSANADSDTSMTIEQSDAPIANDPDRDDTAEAESPAATGPYDDENPAGVTGIFNGNVTTGCSYDPLNHSAHRAIDDIVVPGSIGKYPLKMTRYYNSRHFLSGRLGPGWSCEYWWATTASGTKVTYANGNVYNTFCAAPVGVSDGWESRIDQNGNGRFRLADGGTVVFTGGGVSSIIDPYGQTTNITYGSNWMRVTEPGGRYLHFIYGVSQVNGLGLLLTRVEAHGLGDNTVTDWVNYNFTLQDPGGSGQQLKCLTQVDYSDGTHAYYTYQQDNVPEEPWRGSSKVLPLVATCDDVRYNGPMRQIRYEYVNGAPHGIIHKEKSANPIGPVSTIGPAIPLFIDQGPMPTDFTETRGDGPTRTFHYSDFHVHHWPEPDPCGDVESNNPPSQMLLSYTDFQGHTTYLNYDSHWYINSVMDANGHTTTYQRGPPPDQGGIGQITQITHPDTTYIQYTYQPESGAIGGHYQQTVSDERRKVTTYHRNGTNHQIYQIDYPDSGDYETFSRNDFGQVLNHRLRNGAYESFAYDTRGLLTDKWNPKQTVPAGNDPHTHYTYYTAADGQAYYGWIDRVKTITLPGNYPYGHQATDTYEYDKNAQNQPCPGRGLVTKIRHWTATGDKIQTFGYNQFGNKIWEKDEVNHQTSYAYDSYNRVLTVTNPLVKTTHYTYLPTNGNGTSPYLHTTSNPDKITTPTGIITKNIYDENLRKTSTTAAYGTSKASSTWFHYDLVGNQDYVTDPRGSGAGDSAYTTYTDYDVRNRKWRVREPLNHVTEFHYDDYINVTRIIRPDQTTETKTYDALNRVLTDTVPKDNSTTITTTFNYNPSGTINWVKDGNIHTTTFAYDASDQKFTMTYPNNGGIQSWAYDDAHNLKSHITVSGHTQYFAYDERNRKYADWWDANANVPEWRYFVRDAANRLVRAKNGTATWNQNVISDVTRAYDAANHLTLDQQNVTGLGINSVNYPAYDDDGKLIQMNVTGVLGYDYTFSYDEMGRFEKIIPTGASTAFQYYYDAASNETQRRTFLNGGVYVDKLTPRDSLNRISRRDLQKSGTGFSAEAYTYDPMNRLTGVSFGSVSDQYAYYLDGELNVAQYGLVNGQNPSRTVNYTLDKAGNRTSVVDNGASTTYTLNPNNLNEYSRVGAYTLTNGNEHEISDYQGLHYTYINDERLSSVNDGTNTYYVYYDALGRCVKRKLNTDNNTTYYIYDGEKPILEYNSSDVLIARNVYGKGIDEILMRKESSVNGGAWFYYEDNHEGSVTHLLDASGNKIEVYKYDAFGAITTMADGNGTYINHTNYNNRFLFTGREYAATYRGTYVPTFNFYEYRARAYNPTLGRFMSEDPKLFDAGDYNLFRYCHNDPEDLTDPMGTDSDIWTRTYERMQAYIHGKEMFGGGAIEIGGLRYAAQQLGGLTMAQVGVGQRMSIERAIPVNGQRDPLLDRGTEDRLATLREPVRDMARSLIYHSRVELQLDVRIVPQGAFRTYAEQNDLYARGISPARGGQSFHNFGVAFDIGTFEGRRYIENGPGYTAAGHLGQRLGLEWGGSWSPRRQDPPHFQYLGGQTMSQIRARFEQGLSPIPGY
jgi:RHS repeat-associated protein